MTRDFDPYYAASSQPRRAARDDDAESGRLHDLLEAYAGGRPDLLAAYVARLGIGWLPARVHARARLSQLELGTVRTVLGVAEGYLTGRTDMFGTALEHGRAAIPPLFLHGDPNGGRRLATVLNRDTDALQKLLWPLLLEPAHAREVFAGTRAVGYVAFVQAYNACVKAGRRPPVVGRLLGIPVAAGARLPALPMAAGLLLNTPHATTPMAPYAPPVRTPYVPARMEELAALLRDDAAARRAFGLYVQDALARKGMTWSLAAGKLGYSSRGQFIKLLHGNGQWREQALKDLPKVLEVDAAAFTTASGLLDVISAAAP